MALLLLFPGVGGWGVSLVAMIEHAWALLFVLAQLLLTDHAGRIDRRDVVGLGLGMLGLLCSDSALAMIFAVGLSLALRQRWRAAALAVLPLLAQFTIWYVAIGGAGARHLSAADLAQIPTYVWTGVSAALEGLSALPGGASLMVVGLLLAAAYLRLSPRAPGLSVVYSIAAGGLVFNTLAAIGRVYAGASNASESRYVYLGLIFFLPLLGTVLAALARDRRLVPAVVGLLAWAMIQHTALTYASVDAETALGQNLKSIVIQRAADPGLDTVDPSTPVQANGALYLTVGVIQTLHAEGQLPN
jgi:hypothetical protein